MNDIQVIFDVGAKESNYPLEYPEAICHLFEPNPTHFKRLVLQFGTNPNVILNSYGLGDKDEPANYNVTLESFGGSEALPHGDDGPIYQLKTLDWYIEDNDIDRIDLLKIDTEGMDYKVLLGGRKAIAIARYIQYETWDNKVQFEELISKDSHTIVDIGNRNILCKKN